MVPIGMRHHGNQVCLLFDCEVDTAFSLLYQHSDDTNLHVRGQTSKSAVYTAISVHSIMVTHMAVVS